MAEWVFRMAAKVKQTRLQVVDRCGSEANMGKRAER
jgi:hypothetical protein